MHDKTKETKNGITTLGELIQAYEYETDEKLIKTVKIIITSFPKTLVNISKCYNEDINSDNENMRYILIAPRTRKKFELHHCQSSTSNSEECTEEN